MSTIVSKASSRGNRPVGAVIAGGGALLLAIIVVCAAAVATLTMSQQSEQAGSVQASQAAVADIPAHYLRLYQQAGTQFGLDWSIIAAIGKVETDHGRLDAPGVTSGQNAHGCCAGPMQFHNNYGRGGGTWGAYAVDGNADGKLNIYDPQDAIPAAARYLRASGAPGDYRRAIFAYNHASWYVDDVLATAQRYRATEALPAAAQADVAQLLSNPRITLTDVQRADLVAGGIDPRVLRSLTAITAQHSILVSALRRDHAPGTNHEAGRAVDIAVVDAVVCEGSRLQPCGRLTTKLAEVQGADRSTELIYCFDADLNDPNVFARSDHCDHIHLGYD